MPYTSSTWHNIPLEDKSFLITGGAGFIGSHIAEYLLNHGALKVRILDNFSLGFEENLEHLTHFPALEIIDGDITNKEDCINAMKSIDYVCHLAALGSVPRSINDPIATNHANVSGFLNVIVAAKDAGIKKMIYASSSAVYGDSDVMPRTESKIGRPLSPYALSKYMTEEHAELFGRVYDFHATGLRFFNVFGARQNPEGAYAAVIPRFFKAALENKQPEIYGDGSICRDFTHVSNVVQVCVKAMLSDKAEKIYNVACGEKTSILELWNIIAGVVGSTLQPDFKQGRKGDVEQSLADISSVVNDFSYSPEMDIQDGLKLTYEYYKNLYNS